MPDYFDKFNPETTIIESGAIDGQLPKMIVGLAERTASYYQLLCNQGLDSDFARQLAHDWHTAQLDKWVRAPYTDLYRRPATPEEVAQRSSVS